MNQHPAPIHLHRTLGIRRNQDFVFLYPRARTFITNSCSLKRLQPTLNRMTRAWYVVLPILTNLRSLK